MKYLCLSIIFLLSLNLSANEPFLLNLGEDLDWITVQEPENENPLIAKDCFRFATDHKVDLDPQTVGNTITFDDGLLIWSVGITSPGSKNMNVILKDVDLKIGDYIYIYAPNEENFHQPHLNRHNHYAQTFPIKGDSLIIEYQSYHGHQPTFKVETVNCGFRDVSQKATIGFGGSGGCEINASCEDEFSDVSRAVCRLMIDGNTYGTGVLVNNTSEDGTPYVMTSAHVFGKTQGFTTCIARFGWDAPNCQNKAYNIDYQEVTADRLITYNELRDCALILLDEAPSDDIMPFWAGWDSGEEFHGEESYCIHHPFGDVKKISTGLSPYPGTYGGESANGNLMTVGNHWRVLIWSHGATEGGSSGSPLFDENKRIVGCLTGGEASCSSPMNDYFWQISESWDDQEQTAEMNLHQALDPKNTGKTQLDGLDFSDDKFKDIYNVDEFNSFKTTAENINFLSERFLNDEKYKYLYGMFVGVENTPKIVSNFKVYVYADDNGKPGKEIKSYYFDTSDFQKGTVSYLDFGEALEIDTTFHLAIEKDDNFLQFYYSTSATKDYANFNVDGQWLSYQEMTDVDDYCSIFFGARMSNPVLKNEEITIEEDIEGIQIIYQDRKLSIYGNNFLFIGLYSLDGKKFINEQNFEAEEHLVELDLSGFLRGMYILRVQTQEGKKSQKILVY